MHCLINKKPFLKDKSWISPNKVYYNYQEYYGEFSKEDNNYFVEKNFLFNETLQDLLDYDYHQFWCHILFESNIAAILTHFVLNPIYWYEIHTLDDTSYQIYNVIFDNVLKIYERMLKFKESEVIKVWIIANFLVSDCVLFQTEYINEEIAMNYLCERNYFNTPIIMSLALLYNKTNSNFIRRLVKLYYTDKMKSVYTKEIKRFIEHVSLVSKWNFSTTVKKLTREMCHILTVVFYHCQIALKSGTLNVFCCHVLKT